MWAAVQWRHRSVYAGWGHGRPSFLAYIEQILAPTLKKGDIVFMDNVRTHLVDGVEEAIEARGARVFYLPPYSPDFNLSNSSLPG